METRVLLLLICLLGLNAHAATVRQYGDSAPLGALVLPSRVQQQQAANEPALALRRVTPRLPGAARVLVEAEAPQFTLPSGPGAPALPQVRTGGSSFNLEGMRAGDGSVGGAAGDLQYVQLANGLLAVYRKENGAALLGPVPVSALFSDVAPCAAPRYGGASVHFDQLAGRWIVAYRGGHAGSAPYYLCLAVSAGADATGSYHRFALAMRDGAGRPLYFDDPHMAVWIDAYYFSVNLFDSAAGSYRGPRICGIERAALLRGAEATLRCRDLGDGIAPAAPASLEALASTPGGASPALFLALDFSRFGRGERLLLWRFSFSANRMAAPLAIPVAAFTIACADSSACVGQPAPGAPLAALGERLMPRPVFRNDAGRATLLAGHSVQMADGQLGLRWYEIGDPFGAARVHQQGSVAPDAASRWMGSIGMDRAGNIALGYSVASIDTPPGIRYTGRQRTDPPGRMQAEEVIVNGDGVQSDAARLGQASGALTLDPVDGCTFWYTQRYLPSTGPANWRTRIARFKFVGCQ